jgi:hypothetical protein
VVTKKCAEAREKRERERGGGGEAGACTGGGGRGWCGAQRIVTGERGSRPGSELSLGYVYSAEDPLTANPMPCVARSGVELLGRTGLCDLKSAKLPCSTQGKSKWWEWARMWVSSRLSWATT